MQFLETLSQYLLPSWSPGRGFPSDEENRDPATTSLPGAPATISDDKPAAAAAPSDVRSSRPRSTSQEVANPTDPGAATSSVSLVSSKALLW